MAKVQIEIEALNENCAKCPYIDIETISSPYMGGTFHQELICTRMNLCSAVTKMNKERSENNGNL